MGKRANALADRLEQGVAELAAYVGELTNSEWMLPVRDGRSINVIVHHVGNMYPIEIEAARAIARGEAVLDVTWDDVAAINEKHAIEFASVAPAEALGFLLRNSKEAANAIRGFTDAELDTAAPFSLSYGAIVTAQFVIEDHAMRHAWHHLARIRSAVERTEEHEVALV